MLREIDPRVYRLLRKRAGLTQVQLAAMMGVSKDTIIRWEKGESKPKYPQDEKMLEIAKCSHLELVELHCEPLSVLCGKRVAIVESEGEYQPTTTLAQAQEFKRRHRSKLSPESAAALDGKIRSHQLLGMIVDLSEADLEAVMAACQKEIDQRRSGVRDEP